MNAKKQSIGIFIIATAFITSFGADAGPSYSAVNKSVQKITGQRVIGIEKSVIPGLLEVRTESSIFYTDKDGSYLVLGAKVYSTSDNKNYTQFRNSQLAKFKFEDLPLHDAIKIVRGNGKRVIATFEDPNCGPCRQLAQTMREIKNTTHYIFVVDYLGEESTFKASNILCAPDSMTAWQNWMLEKREEPTRHCNNAVQKNRALAIKYRVSGTPTMFFEDGTRLPGFVTVEALERILAQKYSSDFN